jgi:regulator of protease activity HflC (stomatin/prohibitin superfamily)
MSLFFIALLVVFGLLAVTTLFLSFFTVEQQTAAIIERFGKFLRIAGPGLGVKIPFIDRIPHTQDLRVLSVDVEVETKTKDNVILGLKIALQYFALPEKVYDAYYKLEDPEEQIKSYVFDVVRAVVPKMDLDEVFERKDDVAKAVQEELEETMAEFGFKIKKALVIDVDPDEKVKEAMNDINAAQRQRVAATERGEAEKILMVKAAEAESQSKALQGKGIADQRKAIVEGLRDSVKDFTDAVKGTKADDVMMLVLLTQYFDTLKDIGASSRTNTVLMPHSPGGLAGLMAEIRNTMITADRAGLDDPDTALAAPASESVRNAA